MVEKCLFSSLEGSLARGSDELTYLRVLLRWVSTIEQIFIK